MYDESRLCPEKVPDGEGVLLEPGEPALPQQGKSATFAQPRTGVRRETPPSEASDLAPRCRWAAGDTARAKIGGRRRLLQGLAPWRLLNG